MADFQAQAATAQRANLDFFFGLAGSMLEGEEKLLRLNLDTAKTMLADWYQRVQDALSKQNSQEFTVLQDALALPSAEEVLTYERQVAEIASSTQTQLAEVVNARYQEVSHQVQSFVENLAQNAPLGSEAAIAFPNQGFSLVNTVYESAREPTKQAVDVAQSSLSFATKAVSEVAEAVDEEVEKAATAVKDTSG